MVSVPARGVVELTRETFGAFMANRANALLSNQLGLGALLSSGTGVARLTMNSEQLSFAFAINPDHPIWLNVVASWAQTDGATSGYSLATLGYHVEVSDDVLVGVMAQLDHARDETQTGWVEGAGWLAGPYIVGRAPQHPLRYEARLLYGQTQNRMSPIGTYTYTFATTRVLAQARLTGQIDRDWGEL